MPAALDALQEVERYAHTLKVLRKRHPEKSERDLMESLATIKEGDEAIRLIRTRFEGIPSEEIEREAVKTVREVRAPGLDGDSWSWRSRQRRRTSTGR